jgi:hypothetical protein
MKAWILAPTNGVCGSCEKRHEQGDRILEVVLGTVRRRRCVVCAEGFGPAEDRTQYGKEPAQSGLAPISAMKAPTWVSRKALAFERRLKEATE